MGQKKETALALMSMPTQEPVSQPLLAIKAQPSPQKNTLADGGDPRNYNELMDEYSLHQLIIRRGQFLDQTPEFNSFKRTYLQKWGQISYILMLLEKLLKNADLEMAYVDGRKVAQMGMGTEIDLNTKPSNEELFSCFTNKDEVSSKIKVPNLMFKGIQGPILAATCI